MNRVRLLFILLGIVCATYGLVNSDEFSVPIWLLPLVFSVGVAICKNIIIKATPGVLTLCFLMFLRYVFTPYAYYSDGVINTMVTTQAFLTEGLILMLYELILVFVALELSGRKYAIKYNSLKNDYVKYELQLKNGFIIILGVVLVLIYIGVVYKSLGQGLNAFLNSTYNDLDEIESQFESGEGYINIVWQSLCVWLYIYLVMREKNANDIRPSSSHIIRAILYTVMFIILTFIDSTGVTRWFTFVSAIASLSCLIYLFPSYKKTVGASILIPLAALMIFSSLVKNGGYVKGSTTVAESAEGTFGATNMDVYCNGLGNVNATFQLANINSDINVTTVAVDFLRSIPIINHYVPKEITSTYVFHKAVGRDDQILPLIGQSYAYFGFLLAPLLTILIIMLVRRLDYRFYYNSSYKKYAYAFAVVWIAASPMCHNLSLIFMWLFIRIIPFYAVLALTDKQATKSVPVRMGGGEFRISRSNSYKL